MVSSCRGVEALSAFKACKEPCLLRRYSGPEYLVLQSEKQSGPIAKDTRGGGFTESNGLFEHHCLSQASPSLEFPQLTTSKVNPFVIFVGVLCIYTCFWSEDIQNRMFQNPASSSCPPHVFSLTCSTSPSISSAIPSLLKFLLCLLSSPALPFPVGLP